MAGMLIHGNSDEVTLVAAIPKSVLQIKAPANQRLLIKQLRFFGKSPAGGTDSVVKVRMTRNSANFGTFSAVTPNKNDPTDSETIQSTWGKNASAEPTSPTDSGLWWEVQPQSGIEEFLPIDQPIKIPGGQSAQFECTSPSGTPIMMLVASVEE